MTAATWIELVTAIVTVAGGGTVGVSKLTRIAVAAEQLAEQIKAVTEQQKATASVVQDHENRLNRAKL